MKRSRNSVDHIVVCAGAGKGYGIDCKDHRGFGHARISGAWLLLIEIRLRQVFPDCLQFLCCILEWKYPKTANRGRDLAHLGSTKRKEERIHASGGEVVGSSHSVGDGHRLYIGFRNPGCGIDGIHHCCSYLLAAVSVRDAPASQVFERPDVRTSSDEDAETKRKHDANSPKPLLRTPLEMLASLDCGTNLVCGTDPEIDVPFAHGRNIDIGAGEGLQDRAHARRLGNHVGYCSPGGVKQGARSSCPDSDGLRIRVNWY